MIARIAFVALTIVATACGSSGISKVRFENAPQVWKVNDRVHTEKPAESGFPKMLYMFDRFVHRRLTRLMEVPEPAHAANVNALDEVPDSTWFTNRIGVRDLTAAEIARGPNVDDGPDRSGPWIIRGTKVGGASVGLMMKDPRGVKYILKFDEKGVPDTETAADVIVQRLMWAAGFNVPEDSIVYFERSQLQLAPDAKVSDTFGNKRPMSEEDLEHALSKVHVRADGTYRGLASKFIQGVPLGGLAPEGVRKDDPNDIIPHQERRELRGQSVIFSWFDHTDIKTDNFLDMWVEDADQPGRHYVVHYLVDFGKALGAMGWIERRPGDGFAHNVDFDYMLRSLFTFGLWRRPWEGADGIDVPGVARIESKRFRPDAWYPQYPWEPFQRRDKLDAFWGAKIVVRFTPELIAAAVREGKYEDPRATKYITQTLIGRRHKIARYWFNKVAPLDRFAVEADGRLCYEDLTLKYAIEDVADRTSYAAATYDHDGKRLASVPSARPGTAAGVAGDKTACLGPVTLSASKDGYTVVELETTRGTKVLPSVLVHLARRNGATHVIGLVRN